MLWNEGNILSLTDWLVVEVAASSSPSPDGILTNFKIVLPILPPFYILFLALFYINFIVYILPEEATGKMKLPCC